ncbi:hypothetical protein Mnod_3900 [Methylobacterium nodulans ORS 2060]|uniref:Uncharacterized protein n=1 Tax=Methylobacterium nodulans (strain LMG 21967 / CNCM I-2342 / ORS 2060) TaxID=460265 RepID=B8ISG0_METNO|nr:hypothetical protein Mnod_3900 [Methylobacterium nodulans ORS 2060]
MYPSLDDVIAQTERWLAHYEQCCTRWSEFAANRNMLMQSMFRPPAVQSVRPRLRAHADRGDLRLGR